MKSKSSEDLSNLLTSSVNSVNKINSQRSTGPKTPAGKQRVRMNAFKHGLTGQHMMLEDGEMEVYVSLTRNLNARYQPADELEIQMVQKIIDGHMRLNRLAAVLGNATKIALIENLSDASQDDQTAGMTAAVRGAFQHVDTLLKFARYEAHITRITLNFQRELRAIQAERRAQTTKPQPQAPVEPAAVTPDNFDLALFCKTPLRPYGFVNLNPAPAENPARATPLASKPVPEVNSGDFKG